MIIIEETFVPIKHLNMVLLSKTMLTNIKEAIMHIFQYSTGKYILNTLLLLLISIVSINAQQEPDTVYSYAIKNSAYPKGKGSVIFIDEAHNNFHTRTGRFLPFAKLLSDDGYQVKSLADSTSKKNVLGGCKILVISNPLHASNSNKWELPTPSAFTNGEVTAIKEFVFAGGSVLLIADHMPFAGAAEELAKVFGFEFLNGFARSANRTWPPSVFSFNRNNLNESIITIGTKDYERIDSVATFTGSAFKIPKEAIPILCFTKEDVSLQPKVAWSFDANTPSVNLQNYYQGALLKFGKGRIAVFGEAAMFTAQIANGNKVGINSPAAPQNAQFVLNLIHWLDGLK